MHENSILFAVSGLIYYPNSSLWDLLYLQDGHIRPVTAFIVPFQCFFCLVCIDSSTMITDLRVMEGLSGLGVQFGPRGRGPSIYTFLQHCEPISTFLKPLTINQLTIRLSHIFLPSQALLPIACCLLPALMLHKCL